MDPGRLSQGKVPHWESPFMKTILSGLIALICVSMLAQSAKSQTVPPTVEKASGRQQGEAPAPPILRGSSSFAASSAQPQVPQADQSEVSEEDTVRTSTNLITVPTQVMDRNGRFIGSLRKEDFLI